MHSPPQINLPLQRESQGQGGMIIDWGLHLVNTMIMHPILKAHKALGFMYTSHRLVQQIALFPTRSPLLSRSGLTNMTASSNYRCHINNSPPPKAPLGQYLSTTLAAMSGNRHRIWASTQSMIDIVIMSVTYVWDVCNYSKV